MVGDNYCTGEEKPSTYMSCDLEACEPEWYMTEWGRVGIKCCFLFYRDETYYEFGSFRKGFTFAKLHICKVL